MYLFISVPSFVPLLYTNLLALASITLNAIKTVGYRLPV
jgi:hypothetical protein